MHQAYNTPTFTDLTASLERLADLFIERYSSHVVYLGRMFRAWRNGQWLTGDDAELTTYITKLLRDEERSELTQAERSVIIALKEPEYMDRLVTMLKADPRLRATDEEIKFRRYHWRQYEAWLQKLEPPTGEVKRTGPDQDVIEAKLLAEYEEEVGSYDLDHPAEFENLGVHVVNTIVPIVRFGLKRSA